MATSIERNADLTQRLRRWLDHVDLLGRAERSSIAVDMADIIAASERVLELLEDMLREDADSPVTADRALSAATEIEVQLFTELRSHLDTLGELWPSVIERLDALSDS